MSDRPEWCPDDVWEATLHTARDRAGWLVDAVAGSTQNRAFLRGDEKEDTWATESIYLNGEKAIRIAMARAILAERERCAKIADEAGDTWSGTRDAEQACQEAAVDSKCEEIAREIRSGRT